MKLRRRLLAAAASLPVLVAAAAGTARAARAANDGRSALVIGNAAYRLAPLPNPVNDARLVGRTLRDIGFSVQLRENLQRAQMLSAMRDWIIAAGAATSRIFYFAGHGAQFRGRNYLLPVDAELAAEEEIVAKGIDLSELVDRLARFERGVNLVVLDACRNPPTALLVPGRRTRSVGTPLAPGLAPALAPKGTVVAFSTSPGAVAADGPPGSNSVYTRNLALHMRTPGLPVEMLFKRVRTAVAQETRSSQIPWETSSLIGDFCLLPNVAGQCAPPENPQHRVVDLGRMR
ncbi:MAG TPA: caspase family protein [Burkholderiaceae bacterium]|nr:caspase family protein [Burkholderiaceae bacterium]